MELLCCAAVVGGLIWLFMSWYGSTRNKNKDAEQAVVITPPDPVLPAWPVVESLHNAEEWLTAVAYSAREAHALGAPVTLDTIETYVARGRSIIDGIRRKVDALRRTHGADLHALPTEARRYLERDDERLRQLSGSLYSLRDDLTNAIAAGGLTDQQRFQDLDDNVRAIGWALQQFPR